MIFHSIKKFPAIVGFPAEMLVDGVWHKGKIVEGYRFDDGIVTIEDENGIRYWCGEARKECYRSLREPCLCDELELYINDPLYYLNDLRECIKFQKINIKFCPICGKQLEDSHKILMREIVDERNRAID